ncbi:prephenate dehydrogenase [Allostreptomyces psammosilenae]|uniref:Prephenate dehydrogenase n=1 Tax=Allostreptomyces psammosilenae TaxID=1892865 RepID=A0A852ZLX6_9ACTN|nr:prephenate dehydrogenase [Allostreptomyces psammosilenae]NYI03399.1 prephenate dehydrogenase [Allostreptomyces psammosilenae]
MRSAAVIGTGLIGTSVALALSSRGVAVHLLDNDVRAARTASSLGAGQVGEPDEPVDLAIVAVPPARVGDTLASVQARRLARSYTDVASVKHGPLRAARDLGCELSRYIGGHPMAGREKSGPLAADAQLFVGRPWVLTPTAETDTDTLNRALELVSLCGAVPVVMEAADHDRAVALVSHAPQLVSSLMAARLQHAGDHEVRLAGQGLRDVTRIAASDPAMWIDILGANAGVVADVLAELAEDLRATVGALRAMAAAGPAGAGTTVATDGPVVTDGPVAVEETAEAGGAAVAVRTPEAAKGGDTIADVLRRGNAGHARIPGKHGAPQVRWAAVPVLIGDQPGELARLFAEVEAAGVNVEDVSIEHSPGQPAGLVQLMVAPAAGRSLAEALRSRGWNVRA